MKILVSVSTNRIGSKAENEHEIPDEELEGMPEDERDAYIEVTAQQIMFEMIEWNWQPIE